MGHLTVEQIRKNVEKKGDIFIKTFMGPPSLNGKSKETVKTTMRRWIVYKCKKCMETEEHDIYDTYIRWGPHCKQCRAVIKANNQKVKPESIKCVIEKETKFIVDKIENDIIYLNCGEHSFTYIWRNARDNGIKCPNCKDNYTHPKLIIKKGAFNAESIQQNEDLIKNIPDGYTVEYKSNKYWILKCCKKHIVKCSNDKQAICNLDKLDVRSINQSQSSEDVAKIINQKGAKLLSTYVNYKNLLQLECNQCKTVFYKSYGNFVTKKSDCPICTKKRLDDETKIMNLQKLNDFRQYVKLMGWKWKDTTTIYTDNRTKFSAICPRNHMRTICQDDFVNGSRGCSVCADMRRRLSLDKIEQACLNRGFIFIDKFYKNANTPIKVKCLNPKCHETLMLSYKQIRDGKCPKCHISKSAGALEVLRVLQKNERVLSIAEEYRFDDAKDEWLSCKDKNSLPFDFKVILKNGSEFYIEFDGKQHFEPTPFFGGEESFKIQKYHDMIKSAYCEHQKKTLLRISYIEFNYGAIENVVNTAIEAVYNDTVKTYLVYSNKLRYQSFIKEFVDFEPPNNTTPKNKSQKS